MLTTTTFSWRGARRRTWRGMRNLRPWLLSRMHLRLRMSRAHLRLRVSDRRSRVIRSSMIDRRIPVDRRSIAMRSSRTQMRRTRHRPGNSRRSRTPMIHIRIGSTILPGNLFMLRLRSRSRDVMLIHRHLFLRRRPRLNTTGPAIITHPVVHRHIVDHRPIDISIVYNSSIDIGHRSVVPEMATRPSDAIPCKRLISAAKCSRNTTPNWFSMRRMSIYPRHMIC